MRVKVGDQWFDGHTAPIMVELTEEDKKNIANMEDNAKRYCIYDNKVYSSEEIHKWMKDQKTLLELSVEGAKSDGKIKC